MKTWLEDIDASHWFPHGFQQTLISTYPTDPDFILPNRYTILTTPYPGLSPSNRTILDTWHTPVRGNVIVLRHSARDALRITNVLPSERALIDLVVKE